MPIDLGNLNISIQQFQEVSRGKYNAGDVKLASDHSLERINNHVRMQNLNKVPISHDEVLAVKNAFVKALSGSGVGEEERSPGSAGSSASPPTARRTRRSRSAAPSPSRASRSAGSSTATRRSSTPPAARARSARRPSSRPVSTRTRRPAARRSATR